MHLHWPVLIVLIHNIMIYLLSNLFPEAGDVDSGEVLAGAGVGTKQLLHEIINTT